jgi:hypothetical protein
MTHEEFKAKVEAIPDVEHVGMASSRISKLCSTGAKSFKMTVPPRIDDTDVVLSEVVRRFELLAKSDAAKEAATEDTRPFNPKVVEIFEKYLPKEIAPLAIEAHKRSFEIDESWLNSGYDLPSSLGNCIYWGKNEELGDFESLHRATKTNTITATPEQLREWFPMAYQNEGGENE